ncbi:CoA transferase [Bradyrhizobium sp. CCBAU 21359]|uniref:CoA transferase n=1 Tax=Bradyrhizobium sp. CCBAU 21359 TaxID=1325080 RepID=UPI003FA4CE71
MRAAPGRDSSLISRRSNADAVRSPMDYRPIDQRHAGDKIRQSTSTVCPARLLRCAGEDSWIVVAAADANMWHSLALLICEPDWAENASLKSPAACRCIGDAIETEIAAWALTRDANEAMSELQVSRAMENCALSVTRNCPLLG